MSFLENLFGGKGRAESVILVDIGTSSVAGAYARYTGNELPVVLYTRRLPVEARDHEPQEKAMLRALKILGDTLIREGAPALLRATGSGSASAVLVSIDAPWQKTSVRTEHFEQKEPFTFTRELVTETLEKTGAKAPGKLIVDESIIGTILNGYETNDPYGKKVHRAAVVVLTSLIDERVARSIAETLQSAYHTRDIFPIAGGSLRFQAIQKAFPHERDALILDATGPTVSIALIRKGLFVAVVESPPADTKKEWVRGIGEELADLAKHYPLPRTIFLLAREEEAASLRKALDTTDLAKLWLSDNPPKIVSVLASHVVPLVRQATAATPDLLLLLMALYWKQRSSDER